MEARCGTVASITGENWSQMAMPSCYQTAEGAFFSDITSARKHFLKRRWKIIDGEWRCPVCAQKLEK